MEEEHEEKQRLLIVDDSKVIRITARKILRDHFETIEAVDGENAWEILTGEAPFVLVVSDLIMPRLDGFALLERIRGSHLPHVRELPVIIITGATDSEVSKQRARELGATDFIGKPFDAVHLLARTQAHAGAHVSAGRLREENTLLEERSGVDTTTGLCNEDAFLEHGYQRLSYAVRHNSSLAVLRIEIDDYGDLYRQYGDDLTQSVVQAMGQLLATTTRQEDTAARIGPARFALLLPAMDKHGIHNLAERIGREFAMRTFSAGDGRVQVTVSIGVGNPDIRRDTRFDELLADADRRLAHAIKLGGNRVVREDDETLSGMETDPAAAASTDTTAAAAGAGDDDPASSFIDRLLAGDEVLEIEEIELTAMDLPHTQPHTWSTSPATTSTVAPPHGPLAASFAARPDIPVTGNGRDPQHSARVPVSPSGRTAAGNAGDVRAKPVDEPTDNTADISAPPAAHRKSVPGIASPVTAVHTKDTAPVAGRVPDTPEKDETPQRRKGFFTRPLGLFGRFRTRK